MRAASRQAAVRAAQSTREAAARQAASHAHATADLARRSARSAALAAQANGLHASHAVHAQAAHAIEEARTSGAELLSGLVPVVQQLSPRARRAAERQAAQARALRVRCLRLLLFASLGASLGVAVGVYLMRRSAAVARLDASPDAAGTTVDATVEVVDVVVVSDEATETGGTKTRLTAEGPRRQARSGSSPLQAAPIDTAGTSCGTSAVARCRRAAGALPVGRRQYRGGRLVTG